MILPEILDTSLWFEGKHFYIDAERKYIFVNEGSVSGFAMSINTQLAKVSEFKSYWDIFQPKWKGKIVSLDARDPGFGASELRYFTIIRIWDRSSFAACSAKWTSS